MLDDAIDLMQAMFFNGTFAGSSWIMYMTIIVASLVLITREWSNWSSLALPVMVGWKYFGMPIPTTFMVVGAVIFAIDVLSYKVITGSLGVVGEKLQEWVLKGKVGRSVQRVDTKRAMEELRMYGTSDKEEVKRMREVEKKVKKDYIENIKMRERYGGDGLTQAHIE